MRFYLRLLVLTCFLALGICFTAGRLADSKASGEGFFISTVVPDKDKQTSKAETTLKVLTENCGKCHQSSLPTADSKALAVFDLDKKPWYTSVSDKHLEGISRRIGGKSDISDSDRAATLDFIAGLRQAGSKDKE